MEILRIWRRASFERPSPFETFGERKKRDGDDENADGDCGAERPIVSGAEKALHNIGDHCATGTADEERCEEVAEREYEGESCAGDQAGHREREDYTQKRREAIRAEVVGRFDERAGDVFERGVNR